ncbi:unnamed protein product, partial [Mesorhabditis spiculigera]
MKYLLLAVLCSLGLHEVFSGSCAPGAVDYTEVGQCLLVFKVAAPFAVASKTCGALSGKLAQPISRVENLLTSIAARRTVNATTRVHIGIKQADGRVDRIYADGTPLQYYNFYSESDWASADACTTLDPMCPDGWKYYELTSSCYYIQNVGEMRRGCFHRDRDGKDTPRDPHAFGTDLANPKKLACAATRYASSSRVISSTKALHLNQTAAAAQCAKLGGQLASIHTDAENTFVKMINDYHCFVDQRQNWQSWYAQNEFSRFICKRAALHLPEVGERLAMEFIKQE